MSKKIQDNEEMIIAVLDKIRPFLISDGGNVEFVKYEDDIVYIKMLGACVGCPLIDNTLEDGIETVLKQEVPSIKKVVNLS